MARKARQKSEQNVYLIMFRLQTDIELNLTNKNFLLSQLQNEFEKYGNKFLAYSGDKNNFRFVVYENQNVELCIKSVCIRFANFYNISNNRSGKVFKERFYSLPAEQYEDIFYLISAVHYCNSDENFNSLNNYFNNAYIDRSFILRDFKFKYSCKKYLQQLSSSKKGQEIIKKISGKTDAVDVEGFVKKELKMTLKELNSLTNENKQTVVQKIFNGTKASVRQVVRVTGLPFRFVYSVLKATATAPVKVTKKLLKAKAKQTKIGGEHLLDAQNDITQKAV